MLHQYGAVLIAATLTRALLSWHLRRHPQLLWVAPGREENRITAWIAVGTVAVYGVAMLVAGTARWLSLLLFAAVPLSCFIALLVLKANPKTEGAAQDLS